MYNQKIVLLLILFLFGLTGCTTSLVYNRLDWLITWYVDDYVDLSYAQKDALKTQLQPALQWHRQEELGNYVQLLEGVETAVETPLPEETVSAWTAELLQAYTRVQLNLLDVALEFGATLNDEQMQEFIDSLRDKQAELEDKYLGRSDKKYVQDNYERLQDNLSDYLGELSDRQQQTLKVAAANLQRLDRVWLDDRKIWLRTIQPYLSREEGWQEQIRTRFANRERYRTQEYRTVFAHNIAIINRAITDVLNQRSDKQQQILLVELNEFKADLQTLIAEKEVETMSQQRKLL